MNTLRRFRPMRLWWSVPAGFALPAVLTPSVLCIPRAFLQSAKVPCLRVPLKRQTSCCRHDHHFSLSQALAYAVGPADGATTRIHWVGGRITAKRTHPRYRNRRIRGGDSRPGHVSCKKEEEGIYITRGAGFPPACGLGILQVGRARRSF